MHQRPPPATSADDAVSTASAVAARPRWSRPAAFALALVAASAGPALGQSRSDDDLRDPLRRQTLRTAAPKPGAARTATGSPLRGSLDTRRAEPLPEPAPTTPVDPLATTDPLVDADPAALEPIGRPASAPRTPTTSRADGRTPATDAALPSAPRPMVLDAAAGRRGPVEAITRAGMVKGGPTLPEAAVQPRPRDILADKRDEAEIENDDYAQLGLRTGGFTWLPAVEASAGWTSNVATRTGGASGTVYGIAPELLGRSGWSRHSLEFELRGAYLGNSTDHDYDKLTFRTGLRGRVDLGDETTVDIKGGWSRDRQSSSSADNPANTVVPATVDTKSLSLGLTRDVGLLALTLRGDLDRTDYSGGTTSSGTSLGSEIQNNTRHTAALRAAWGSKSSIRPFAELQASKRDYDDALVAGSPRDTTGAAIKLGVLADLGPKLRGELSTGWGLERMDKGTLPDISGWLIDGSLVWSPTRLTSVKLDARTSFDATTLANSPGAVTRTLAIGVDHALRPQLVASAGVALTDKRYVGANLREDTWSLSSGLTYKIDRNVRTFVKGSFSRFTSSGGGSDYDAATVMVGVRLQR
ncbi:MAG: outer membrane beta-barrel protein [Siculibacillus sp.]|nr:outer membrane beta-barrel protein [Siculibacillus sp.]